MEYNELSMTNRTGILNIWLYQNKHTVSIAKAIQVPHRPQQIPICNHYFGALFNKEQLELLCPWTHTKIDVK